MRFIKALALVLTASALVTACGGGDDIEDRLNVRDPVVRFIHAVPGGANVTFFRGYSAQDNPVYGADAGPSKDCNLLLDFPYSQRHLPPPSMIPNFDDGVDQPLGKGGNNRPAPVLGLGPLLVRPLAPERGVSAR